MEFKFSDDSLKKMTIFRANKLRKFSKFKFPKSDLQNRTRHYRLTVSR